MKKVTTRSYGQFLVNSPVNRNIYDMKHDQLKAFMATPCYPLCPCIVPMCKNPIDISIYGIKKSTKLVAEALGVTTDDIIHTFGCEVEFQVVSEDTNVFRKRLGELSGSSGGYSKEESGYMPLELSPSRWQSDMEKDRVLLSSTAPTKTDTERVVEHISLFTMEPTTYSTSIELVHRATNPAAENFRDDALTFSYLPSEVVSKPIASPLAAAEWLSNIGQYLLNSIKSKKEGAHLDFRAKPTTSSLSNSIHAHLGMRVFLHALVMSPTFSPEQRSKMLKRNTRFYREKLQKGENNTSKHNIAICVAIEEACSDGESVEAICSNEDYADIISKISVNMFSKRELEADKVIIDEADISAQYARGMAKIEMPREIITKKNKTEYRLLRSKDIGCTRVTGTDEISQFGLIFARTLEKFNHDCALIIAPVYTSYQRLSPFNTANAPIFNGGAQRKTTGIWGSYLFRGDGRVSYGLYNQDGRPDTGDLRIETRIISPEAIGHPNHAYPNQKPMSHELIEGIAYVFAKASQGYEQYLQGKGNALSENEIFDTYGRCLENLPQGASRKSVIPKKQLLPKNEDVATARFIFPGGMAEEIYGKDRLPDMIVRRKQLEEIIELDFQPFNVNLGPQSVHTELRTLGIDVIEPILLQSRHSRSR